MTFHDYYLRGADEVATTAALAVAGLLVDGGAAEGVSLSVIGTIYEGGQYGPDGEVLVQPVPLPGWHINMRLTRELTSAEASALAVVLIEPPATPFRVWA